MMGKPESLKQYQSLRRRGLIMMSKVRAEEDFQEAVVKVEIYHLPSSLSAEELFNYVEHQLGTTGLYFRIESFKLKNDENENLT